MGGRVRRDRRGTGLGGGSIERRSLFPAAGRDGHPVAFKAREEDRERYAENGPYCHTIVMPWTTTSPRMPCAPCEAGTTAQGRTRSGTPVRSIGNARGAGSTVPAGARLI